MGAGAFKLAVLASGTGSNLQVIVDKLHGRVSGIEVVMVAGNNPQALALERAARADIATAVFPPDEYPSREARDWAMAAEIENVGTDLVVLAGYMHLLTEKFLGRFPYRVINLHPALLPSFPGDTPIPDTVRYGVKLTGVTVHFVDGGVDTGPVILQEVVVVEDDDTEESLASRIHKVEHRLLPRAIELIAGGYVKPPVAGGRLVRVDNSEPSQIA